MVMVKVFFRTIAQILNMIRRRYGRVFCAQLSVLLIFGSFLLWRWRKSSEYNRVMGREGPVFNNILDEYSWQIVSASGQFILSNHGKVILTANLGGFSNAETISRPCSIEVEQEMCVQFGSYVRSVLSPYSNHDAQCFTVESFALTPAHNPMDCFELNTPHFKTTHWYGGAETSMDSWPINMNIEERPHVSDHGGYGSVLERYWFTSNGVGIFVDDSVPLHVKGDQNHFCLIGKYDGKIYKQPEKQLPVLKYTICAKGNVLDTHLHMSGRYIKKPTGIPDENMIKYPVWSTWAKYKSAINEALTIKFTDEIAQHDFPACQIEIDDHWSSKYGDYKFNSAKFPSPKEMISHIHSKGFRVTVWTHPFSNMDSESYTEGREKGFWVKDESGTQTGLARWWRGQGGALDVTNPEAVKWFHERLNAVRDLGVDGHKFDAGEIGFLPELFKTTKPLKNPCQYSTIYAETMYNITNRFMQMRVGYKTQHLPIFVSMMDRSSSWGRQMGLQSLISTSLVFSSLGYFFIMPDMIGGNAYCSGNMDCTNVVPERELYIRWVQLAAFLPMMQFSFTPWQYDDEVVEIARTFVNFHAEYVAPRVIALARNSVTTGWPIIRPMWWGAPDDKNSFAIDTQFMIGSDLLVAPILEKGAEMREVYLPRGVWKDMLTKNEYTVEKDGYMVTAHATLRQVPYFERVLMP